MSWIATGAIVGSALIGAHSSKKAADSSEKSSRRGIAEQRRQYDLTRADSEPFRRVELESNNRLWELIKDPNYVRNTSQIGIDALDNSAAARGLYGSTGHKKRITDHVSRGVHGDYISKLFALSRPNATQATATFGQNTTNNLSALQGDIGNARASSYIGTGNAVNNGLNQYMYGRGAGTFDNVPRYNTGNLNYFPTGNGR